jgi:MFS family permease
LKFLLIFLLYMAQGIATGFLVGSVPAVFRAQGVPLTMLWVAAVPPIFYSVKFLWAPLADRYWVGPIGRRRSWLIPSATALALSFVLLSRIPPDRSLLAAVAGLMVAGLAAATMDIGTDAYAVELLDPHERGLGNGLQSAGLAAGSIIGSGLVLVWIDRLGWSTAMLIVAGLIPLVAGYGLFRREPPPPAEVAAAVTRPGSLRAVLTRPGTPAILLLAFATGLSYYLLLPAFGPFLVDSRLSLSTIGSAFGTIGTVAGVSGALLGGISINRLGFRNGYRTPLVGGLVAAILLATMASVRSPHPVALLLAVAAGQLVLGALFAVFYANVMNWCSRAQAATDFTLISSVFASTAVIGGATWGRIAHALGYRGHFLVVAFVFAAALLLLGLLHPRIATAVARSFAVSERELVGRPKAPDPIR